MRIEVFFYNHPGLKWKRHGLVKNEEQGGPHLPQDQLCDVKWRWIHRARDYAVPNLAPSAHAKGRCLAFQEGVELDESTLIQQCLDPFPRGDLPTLLLALGGLLFLHHQLLLAEPKTLIRPPTAHFVSPRHS